MRGCVGGGVSLEGMSEGALLEGIQEDMLAELKGVSEGIYYLVYLYINVVACPDFVIWT